MERRKAAGFDFETSEIGIGTYCLSGVYGRVDTDAVLRTLRRAYELGITFFDTGPGYGDAEKVLGEATRPFRGDIIISTKVAGAMTERPLAYENIIASCERSLERLGVERIDLYGIHFDDGGTPVEEVVRAFDRLKAAGKIRFCGLGHVFAGRARAYFEQGGFCSVMGELSAVSTGYYRRILPLVRGSRAGYLGFSVTGRGLLAGAVRGRAGLEEGDIRHIDALFAGERLESALRIAGKMAETARAVGATPAQVAVRWVLNREGVVCAITGPSSEEHLEENAGACAVRGDTDAFKALEDFIDEEARAAEARLRAEIESVLRRPFVGREGIPDLVYVAENMGEVGIAPEESLIPAFKRLLGFMKSGACEDADVDRVKRDLARLLDG